MYTNWSELLTEEQIKKLEALSEGMQGDRVEPKKVFDELSSIAAEIKKSGIDPALAKELISRLQKVAIYVNGTGQLGGSVDPMG